MEDKIILNSTELTGILGKSEIKKLSKVLEKNNGRNIEKITI